MKCELEILAGVTGKIEGRRPQAEYDPPGQNILAAVVNFET